jgi:flagellar hook-associated protein 1 FlgK
MSNSLFSIGMSGLWAAQAQVLTTGHNIANVDTPNYSRQEVVQSTRAPHLGGGVYFGTGTDVVAVRRVYGEAITQQLTRASAQSAQDQTRLQRITDLETLFGSAGGGVASAIDAFTAAASQLAADPDDPVVRQSLLSAGESLAAQLRGASRRIDELRGVAIDDIRYAVAEVNAYATELARVNQQILGSQGSPAQQPHGLLDQRDQLVAKLNELIGATAVRQSDGTVNVFIGSGQPLVTGTSAYPLEVLADATDPQRVQLATSLGPAVVRLPNELVEGGRIGGNLRFLDDDATYAEAALGRLALTLAERLNAQHRVGVDLNGQLGSDLFVHGAPAAVAAADNSGTATIDVTLADPGALEASDYRLQYDGSQYALTRLSDGLRTTFATLPQTVDGLELTLGSGTLAAGDVFMVKPYQGAARDFALALTDVEAIAAASPVVAAAGAANAGSVRARLLSVAPGAELDPNLQAGVTLTFTSAGTFDVSGAGTGNPSGLTYVPGTPVTFNGWTLVLEGTPVAGDTLGIAANAGGTGNNGNASALAGATRTGVLDGGRTSIVDGAAQIVGVLGSKGQQAKVAQRASASLLEQAARARETLSGVNLDEEAAKLVRYQQAYQAASRVIAVADSLFETLLGSIGR